MFYDRSGFIDTKARQTCGSFRSLIKKLPAEIDGNKTIDLICNAY